VFFICIRTPQIEAPHLISQRRTGRLTDGWIDGDVVLTDDTGAVIGTERFAMGERIEDGR
jgi:hypothetical protein